MAKTKRQTTARGGGAELDSVYFLKLVLYLIVGAQWVRLENPASTIQFPLPLGLLIGLIFAAHEHFKIDRKIEFALLLVAMLVGFWTHVGIYVTY